MDTMNKDAIFFDMAANPQGDEASYTKHNSMGQQVASIVQKETKKILQGGLW